MTSDTTTAGTLPAAMLHAPSIAPPPGGARKWRPNYDRTAPKVWSAEKAKTIPGYPKTPEAYEAMRERSRARLAETRAAGKLKRTGVPNGWSGKKVQLAEIQRQAATEGHALLDAARAADLLGDEEDPRVRDALTFLAEAVRTPTLHATERLIAARTLLEFLMLRPVRRGAVTTTAETVLTALAAAAGLSPLTIQPAPTSAGESAHADH